MFLKKGVLFWVNQGEIILKKFKWHCSNKNPPLQSLGKSTQSLKCLGKSKHKNRFI